MAQNIYDNPDFFQGYKALRQNDTGLNGALELPALLAQLPPLTGLSVLDLGCGFGDFARHARHHGTSHVLGLDVSEKMLAEAARLTDDHEDGITYKLQAMESFSSEAAAFDLVVSSMALHYVQDYSALVDKIFKSLKPGGMLVFSVEHPCCTANPVGWVRDQDGQASHWPLDRYQEEGERLTSWFVDGVTKYHRTVETYVGGLLSAGFVLRHLGEPKPLPKFLEERPVLQETLRRPPVLLLSVQKPL